MRRGEPESAVTARELSDKHGLAAEWFMEGLLHRILDRYDPVSRKCLQRAVFYIVSSPYSCHFLLQALIEPNDRSPTCPMCSIIHPCMHGHLTLVYELRHISAVSPTAGEIAHVHVRCVEAESECMLNCLLVHRCQT